MKKNELEALAVRVADSVPDRRLDAEAAIALGWQQRIVTGLGLNGRTPGRLLWFAPYRPDMTYEESRKSRALPRFTGPRKRAATAASLRALAQSTAPSREGA